MTAVVYSAYGANIYSSKRTYNKKSMGFVDGDVYYDASGKRDACEEDDS